MLLLYIVLDVMVCLATVFSTLYSICSIFSMAMTVYDCMAML
nr:hypothetical protein ABT39_MTgene5445 [Picea glauca]